MYKFRLALLIFCLHYVPAELPLKKIFIFFVVNFLKSENRVISKSYEESMRYAPNIGAPKYIKQILTDIKERSTVKQS